MNRQIQQLAEQAKQETSLYGGKPGDREFDERFNKMFAELIVGECMACSAWVGRMNNHAIEPVHTAHAINQRIKKHFGVEE